MHKIRFALTIGLLRAYKKRKSSSFTRSINKFLPNLRLVPLSGAVLLASAAPNIKINNDFTPCPTSPSSDPSDSTKCSDQLPSLPPVKLDEPIVKPKCRPFYIAGNLKMFANKSEIDEIIKRLKKSRLDPNVEVVLVAPNVYIQHVKSTLPSKIAVGAPNCYHKGKGAFTGEVSPLMVKEVGADWVAIGQSERRRFFGEKDEIIGPKICRALHDGLKVIACVGENIEEREKDEGCFTSLDKQLRTIASHVNGEQWCNVVIAYEPTWTFGTGKKCLPEDVQEAHEFIRDWLEENVCSEVADSTRIIYGGAVANGKEAELYARQDDVDGFLVGYQTVKPEFIEIVNVIQDTNKEVEERKKARAKEFCKKK